MIEIGKIHQNPYQPRQDFDPRALDDLKNSIIEHGIIQPVTVRRDISGFELLAGERRLRAASMAGLDEIPAYVLDIDRGVDSLAITLIENVQREDLNPIETANGYQRLIEECKLTQEEVATKVGKERSTVTNFLRLLRLPEKIQDSLRRKEISMGHARAMLGLSTRQRMLAAWQLIFTSKLSVRQTERLVKDIEAGKIKVSDDGELQKPKKKVKPIKPELEIILEENEDRLRHLFGTKVRINAASEESGKIELEFYSKDDLERLIDLMSQIDPGK